MSALETQWDTADQKELVERFGEHYWIAHPKPGVWMATPRPRQQDILTSSNPEGLAAKLEQALARRQATDLSGLLQE